ncbi:MAG: hypothetical protein H0X23_10445 [Rubrobacter sp.]|jgi:hypothetical protein|nr:hypothetical protein [Rubrobacter sp.]
MFKWFIALILAVETGALILLLLVAPAPVAWTLAPAVPLTVILALLLYSRKDKVSRWAWRLSPERITHHRSQPARADSPEDISNSIIERTAEIRRALQEDPRSEMRLQMCALGYRACVNDMITLTHLVNEQSPNAPLFRRLKLRRARKRAIEALSATRQALPPGLLRAEHQERQ